jgi:hypothetical protein
MNDAQITGSTSSYARKYALNGLFAIDDSEDADASNKGEKKSDQVDPLTEGDKRLIAEATTVDQLRAVYQFYTGKNKKAFEQACTERKAQIEKL